MKIRKDYWKESLAIYLDSGLFIEAHTSLAIILITGLGRSRRPIVERAKCVKPSLCGSVLLFL